MAYFAREHGLIVGASGADLATTYLGLSRFPVAELNPLPFLLSVSPILAMLLIKIAVVLCVVILTEGIVRRYPELHRHMRLTLRFSFCLIMLAAVNNGSLILKHGLGAVN